jgi:hypothetical protein
MFGAHLVRSHTALRPHESRARAALHQSRREKLWAWLSLVTLVLCWDASIRLDERVSPPRVRIAHIGETSEVEGVAIKKR